MLKIMFKKSEENIKVEKFSFLKKVIITTCLGLSLTFTTALAEEIDTLETVSHVYVGDEHIGKVNNEEVVQNLIDDKLREGKKEFEDMEVVISETVSFVPEKVFDPKYNNDKVINRLEDELTLVIKAVEVKIGNKILGNFKEEKVATNVLKEYKMQYVDVEDLNKVEASVDNETETILSLGESIVKDVTLSEEVSLSERKVLPNKILNMKQGVKMLEKGTLEEKVHKIKAGEVLGGIASKYSLSMEDLLGLNPSLTKDNVLQIDQKVNVMEYKPFVDVVVTKEELVEEKVEYETETIKSDDMYKGEEKLKQEGKNGTKEVQYEVEMSNGELVAKKMTNEKITKEAIKEMIIIGTKVIPSRGTGNLSWPANGGYISSKVGKRWGRMHKGIDIARPSSRAITTADHGVVESAGWSGGYGNKIVINHNNGMKTVYAHLSSISVKAGQTVEKGTKIGIMGSTGNSTGVHLHFEVYNDGVLGNPMNYF